MVFDGGRPADPPVGSNRKGSKTPSPKDPSEVWVLLYLEKSIPEARQLLQKCEVAFARNEEWKLFVSRGYYDLGKSQRYNLMKSTPIH